MNAPAPTPCIPSAIHIEKGVAFPAAAVRIRVNHSYPWADMEVGDSFALPLTGERWATLRLDKAAVRISRAANAWVTRHQSARKFSVRTLEKEGVVRCWRVR